MDSYYTERVSRISTLKGHALLDERSFRRFVERCHAKSWLKETLKSTSVSLICLAVFLLGGGLNRSTYGWQASCHCALSGRGPARVGEGAQNMGYGMLN